MCNIHSTLYACSHTRKTLLQPCPLALLLAPIPHNRAPSFCLNGLTITSISTSPSPCSRSTHKSFSCSDLMSLVPFLTREATVQAEFEDYMHRVQAIATCLKNGVRPECWFGDSDGVELRKQHDVYWTETLPDRVRQVRDLLADAVKEMAVASAYAVNAILGREVHGNIPRLDVRLDYDLVDDGEDFILQMYAQVLEELAIVMCLDGVGWSLPVGDDEAVGMLMAWVEGRDVRPMVGGIEMNGQEDVDKRVDEGVQMEEYDVLDVAEEKECWKF